MGLLNPWALGLGAGAVALPFIVHWLTRPRPTRLALSTVRFVREAIRQRRARYRLRDLIILTLRAMAVLLLGMAFSRPLLGHRPLVPAAADAPGVRVVILDVSLSMNARTENVTAMERGRAIAARYLTFAPGTRANLILAGAVARPVFEVPSTNFGALRDALASAVVRPEGLDATAALTNAAELLAFSEGDDPQRRELVVISDFQRTNWVDADFSRLPKETRVQFESVAPAEPPGNLAVVDVTLRGRLQPGLPVPVDVAVANFSDTPRQASVSLRMGEDVQRIEGPCPPMGKVLLTASVLVDASGWPIGLARLLNAGDGLPEDDTRWFTAPVTEAPTFAMITRQESKPAAVSSYFLERALSPFSAHGRGYPRILRIDPMGLTREALLAADLLVIDHPGKLATQDLELLASLVRRGKSMLYVASEPVDATNLARLSAAAGDSLRMPIVFIPPSSYRDRRGLYITDIRADRPPFRVFGDAIRAALSPVRFSGGLNCRPAAGGQPDEVLATLNDGSALLVGTPLGAGRVFVLNADLGASTFVTTSAFLPVIQELVDLGIDSGGARDAVRCGRPLAMILPAVDGRVEGLGVSAEGIDGLDYGRFVEERTGVLWEWPEVGPPGVYTVTHGEAPILALAAATDPEESDLRTISASVLMDQSAGGPRMHFRAGWSEGEPRDTTWSMLATACLACMMLELLMHGLMAS